MLFWFLGCCQECPCGEPFFLHEHFIKKPDAVPNRGAVISKKDF